MRTKGVVAPVEPGAIGPGARAAESFCVRGSADRSRSACWPGFPAMAGPGGAEEPAGDDDGVGQGDVGLDHRPAAFGADGELLEASVVPGVGPLDDPAGPGL